MASTAGATACGDRQALGVAEQALEVAPLGSRASRAAGRRLASVRGPALSRSWSSATARNRWLPPSASSASRWSVSGGSGSGGGTAGAAGEILELLEQRRDLRALLPGS